MNETDRLIERAMDAPLRGEDAHVVGYAIEQIVYGNRSGSDVKMFSEVISERTRKAVA